MLSYPHSYSSSRLLYAARLIAIVALLTAALSPIAPAQAARTAAPGAPSISASMTDAVLVDTDGDGRADPGETLRYTVDVTNSGAADATGLSLTPAIDPNTAIVPGSERVSPLAFADSYTALRDTPLVVPAPGLLGNDTGTPAPAATAETKATTAGGSVTIAANGSFTYTAPSRYTGADSFTYTAVNALGSDAGTVTITAEGAPQVLSTAPANAAAAVPANSAITVTFDEPVAAAVGAFAVDCGSGSLPFTLSASPAASYTIDPDADLPIAATCTVTVTAAQVTDVDTLDPPDTMAADYSFSFVTADPAPTVTSTVPASAASGVATDVSLTVNFSESVNATKTGFTLVCGTPVSYSLSASPAASYTLTPDADLPEGTSCTVTVVAAAISDADSIDPPDAMAADYAFSFTTDAAPTVTSISPADGATAVAVGSNLVVAFSESVNASTSSFDLVCGVTPVSYTLSSSPAASYTINPDADLPATSSCTLTVVAAQVTDADSGDPPDAMAADVAASFTTTDSAPSVSATTPADGATGVAADATVTVDFSESVSATTSSFTLACGASNIAYTLSAAPASSYTLTPSAALPAATTCTLTVVAAQVSDTDAVDPPNAMAANEVVSFTTDAAPTVTGTAPADGASDVAVGATITVTFSESVDATTSSFDLVCDSTPVSYTLSSSPATSFTLTPDADLPVAASCSVTVNAVQVTDVDANDPPDEMAADYVFDFTTADVAPTVTGVTPADGTANVATDTNIVVSFSESVAATTSTFTLVCDSAPVAYTLSASPATSYTLNPSADLAEGASCTVTVVAAQVSDTDTVDPPNTMAANEVVSFTTDEAPTVSATTPVDGGTDVDGTANITVTFSEAVAATTSTFTLVCDSAPVAYTLSASPATSYTLNPTVDLPVGASCSVTVTAAEIADSDAGDPPDEMAADYVFDFTTADVAPTVTGTTPADGTANVATDANIVVNFSESVDATTSSFTLVCDSTPVAYTLSASPATSYTLNPSAALAEGASCSVTVVAAQVSDSDSVDPPQNMAADESFDFTVDTAPTVTSVTPADSAANVATDANIVVNFSESVDATTSSFTLVCDSTPVAYTLSASPATSYTLNPNAALAEGASCSVTVVAAEIADSDAGDPPDGLAADYVSDFTVDTAPTVTGTTPADGATNVVPGSTIVVNFSESVDATTSSFTLVCDSTPVAYTLSASPATSYTLTPGAALAEGASCSVTVTAAQIADSDAGDPPDTMAADYVFDFTADAAPTVTGSTPADSATNVGTTANIVITFSESVNVTSSAFALACPAGSPVTFVNTTGTGPATSFTLDPSAALPANTNCTVTVEAAEVSDADAGDPPDTMAANATFSFTTDAAPTVTGTTPANGATGVAVGSDITITFSESVAYSASSFAVECPVATPVAFTLTSSSPGTQAVLNPTGNLPAGTVCTVTVTASAITDTDAGDPPDSMAADYVFTFSAPPQAVDDTYAPQVVGNVPVDTSAVTQFSVLANDLGANLTASAGTTTARGGKVSVAATGLFSYTPPAGYEGTDTFTYTVSNSTGAVTGTVSLTVAGMIWFVDNTAPAGGNGQLDTPFNSLGTLHALNDGVGSHPAAGDSIFVYESATPYGGTLTLLGSQKLIGQDSTASLAQVTGLTIPADSVVPSMASANGEKTQLLGQGVALATGNTLRGFTVGGAVSADTAVRGTGFGTLSVNEVTIDGVGPALALTNGTATGSLGGVTSTGGVTGVSLTDVSGSLVLGGGSLNGHSGSGLVVSGGDASISYAGTIAAGAGVRPVDISGRTGGVLTLSGAVSGTGGALSLRVQNNTGGSVTFSGPVSASASQGVQLLTNTGSSVAFDGGLTLSTGANPAFAATGGGTVTVTGSGNTVTTTAATGVDITGTTIGAGGVTFRSVAVGGGTNGIVLSNTGAGAFTVEGNSTPGSGGTVSGITGAAVSLTNVGDVTLQLMTLQPSGASASGLVVSGGNGTIGFTGTIAANGARPVDISGRTGGSVTLSDAVSGTGGALSLRVQNNTGGSVTFSGPVSASASQGVQLLTNTGTSVAFSGGLTLSTGANAAFAATGGGTVTVTGSGNTVTTTTGTGVNITGTTIGAGGVTFRSVTVGSAPNGIVLSNTGAGAFTVTGDGVSDTANTTRGRTTQGQSGSITLGSGGTINGASGVAVSLTSTSNVTLRNMVIQNSGGDGVDATTVAGLTLDNMRITGQAAGHGLDGSAVSGLTIVHSEIFGNATAAGTEASDIWNIRVDDLTGSSAVTHSLFYNTRENVFGVNNSTATALTLTVTNSEFRDTDAGVGNNGLGIVASASANVSLSVSGSTFLNNRSNGIQYTGNGSSGGGTVTVQNSIFNGNATDINIGHQGAGKTVTFNVLNNQLRQTAAGLSTAINIFLGSQSTGTSQLVGTVSGNVVGTESIPNSGSLQGNGIALFASGAGTLTALVNGNTVRQVQLDSAMWVASSDHTGRINLTVSNNDLRVNTAAGTALAGMDLTAGALPSDSGTVCANIQSNNSAFVGDPTFAGIYLVTADGNPVVELQGYAGAADNVAAIQSFLNGRATTVTPNSLATLLAGTVRAAAGTCATPLTAAGGVGSGAAPLAADDLAGAVSAAKAQLRAAGLVPAEEAALAAATVLTADLDGATLASTTGNGVLVDSDAAGWGWFVDATPAGSAEFRAGRFGDELRAASGSPAFGRVDLLTVVLHELGHVIGREHTLGDGRALMDESLGTGARRLLPGDEAKGTVGGILIGVLPAGKHVRVTFDVTIANPLPAGVAQLSAQATVSGSNFAAVLSDDPELPGGTDPTVTSLARFTFLPLVMGDTRTPDLVVDDIRITGGVLSVTIRNRGEAPVVNGFWVDAYIGPRVAPTAVNQTWQMLGSRGAAWGVTGPALPLDPGESLTLTVGDAYYRAESSEPGGAIAAGTRLYAQADAVNTATTYGAVLETHEVNRTAYNNITGPVTVSAPVNLTASVVAGRPDEAGLPARTGR